MSEITFNQCLLVVAVVLFIYVIRLYNNLIIARQRVRESASDIDTQLKRRYDLIPNLVQTVKGYAAYEKSAFESVVTARSQAMNIQGLGKDKAKAENMLTDYLKTVFALSENYPELKANENFLMLQQELSDTENKIQASRRFYNTTVLSLNTKVETFPAVWIAKIFNFQKESFFELADTEKDVVRNVPPVSF